MDKKNELVLPGQFLTVEEEYEPGKNTFEDEKGKIYSTKVGEAEFNEKERKVNIKERARSINLITPGSIVIGNVILVKDNSVVLSILKAEKNGQERIPQFSSGQVMISNVSRNYVKELRSEFKIGDIVKAKVINVTNYSIDLTTAEEGLGVIKAFCSKCRNELGLFGRQLKCLNCGSIENRKLSFDYSK
ncbi:MAG: exosome complex RNA-binding protein Csl4 [Candidatus Diapherotrites archaeon]